jgi:hypothetical protein
MEFDLTDFVRINVALSYMVDNNPIDLTENELMGFMQLLHKFAISNITKK